MLFERTGPELGGTPLPTKFIFESVMSVACPSSMSGRFEFAEIVALGVRGRGRGRLGPPITVALESEGFEREGRLTLLSLVRTVCGGFVAEADMGVGNGGRGRLPEADPEPELELDPTLPLLARPLPLFFIPQ